MTRRPAMPRGTRAVLLVFLLAGCIARPAANPAPARLDGWLDRLYFGRSIDGREAVSDAMWERFLNETVTPRFPDGYTVLRAEGRWRGTDTTEAERSFVLEVVHRGDSTANARMLEIAREYRLRFRQQAVLRMTVPVDTLLVTQP